MRGPFAHLPTLEELEVLAVLWEIAPAGVEPVAEVIRQRHPIDNTTLASLLRSLTDRGMLRRGQSPKGFVWSPALPREDMMLAVLDRLLEVAYDGSAAALVDHLSRAGRLEPAGTRSGADQPDAAPPAAPSARRRRPRSPKSK